MVARSPQQGSGPNPQLSAKGGRRSLITRFPMSLRIEIEREEDGRWIGEVPDLPGVFAYGDDRAGVIKRVKRSRCACWPIA